MWTRFVDPERLLAAWSPHPDAPWAPYVKPTLFAALDRPAFGSVPPVAPCAPGLDDRAPGLPRIPEHTAVVLDLPGRASVAYAAWLARANLFAPVPLFNHWPHVRGLVDAGGVLGTLLYYVPWAEPSRPARHPGLPPAFLLDRTRLGWHKGRPEDFDNRYYIQDGELPAAATFKRHGIRQLLYLRPPMQAGEMVEVDDLNGPLHRLAKEMPLAYAEASLAEFAVGPMTPWAPGIRKSIFTSRRGPGIGEFRRNARGGFGELIPVPGSSGGGFG